MNEKRIVEILDNFDNYVSETKDKIKKATTMRELVDIQDECNDINFFLMSTNKQEINKLEKLQNAINEKKEELNKEKFSEPQQQITENIEPENRLEELIARKIEYEKQEKEYLAKLENLQKTKSYYEEESLNDKINNIIETLNNSIEENELKIKKIKERKKAVATIIKTIKGSNTKIANKKNKIPILNTEIKEITDNINQLENKLKNIQTTNSSDIEALKNEIDNLNKRLEEKNKELKLANRIIKGAETARKNAFLRYSENQNDKKTIVRKRNIKVKVRKFKYEETETLEPIKEDNKRKSIISNESPEEILARAEKAREEILSKPGGMFSEAEYEYNKVINDSGKKEEIEKILQEKNYKWFNEPKTEVLQEEITNQEEVKQEEVANQEEIIKEDEVANIKELEQNTENINYEQQNIDIKQENTTKEESKLEDDTNKGKKEDIFSISKPKMTNSENKFEHQESKLEKMKIVLKEYKEDDDDISYKTYEEYEESYEEYDRYIEIDGKKYEINRELDRNTENEIDEMCKEILGIEGKASVIKNIAMNNLKRKVDPAIVNAVKGIIMENVGEWNEIIYRDYGFNKVSWQVRAENDPDGTRKRREEIQSKITWAEKAKQKAEEEYKKFLKDYIEAIKEKNNNKLPFAEIVYNCNGKMSSSEYNKISSYINAAQTVGGQVVGKRKFFGLFKGNVSINEEAESEGESFYKEGDTSFVEHVSTDLQALNKKHNGQTISKNKEKNEKML